MTDKFNITDQELEQYIRDHGYEVSDLTEEELAEVREEIRGGGVHLDGVLSPLGPVWIRLSQHLDRDAEAPSK
jgi:hypothetical protein